MKANLATVKKLESSFLSCEKDFEAILKKLFVENQPYSDDLKRLLVINTKDCLNRNNVYYNNKISQYDLAKLKEEGYIQIGSLVRIPESEEVKSYLGIGFSNFIPNAQNPQYRDCTVAFYIVTHDDYNDIGDYQLRPMKIIGYIDGLLNNCKLSGIGTLNFLGCNSKSMDENFVIHTLTYKAIHGVDDKIPVE